MKSLALAVALAGCIKSPSPALHDDFGGASSTRPCEVDPCGGTLDGTDTLAFGIVGAVGIAVAVGIAFMTRK